MVDHMVQNSTRKNMDQQKTKKYMHQREEIRQSMKKYTNQREEIHRSMKKYINQRE